MVIGHRTSTFLSDLGVTVSHAVYLIIFGLEEKLTTKCILKAVIESAGNGESEPMSEHFPGTRLPVKKQR